MILPKRLALAVDLQRSKEACFALIEDGQGILVSDGYGVYPNGAHDRPTCWAHLIRTVRGLSEKRDLQLAACSRWVLKEVQGYATWPRRRPLVGSGARGRRGFAT